MDDFLLIMSLSRRIAALEAALAKQVAVNAAVNEVLLGLIMASPITASERDKAREMYESALESTSATGAPSSRSSSRPP